MKTKLLFMMVLAGSLALSSCTKYPGVVDRLDEDMVVMTQYDTKNDFGQYTTFAVPDSLVYYTDSDSGRVKNSNTQLVVNQIIENMQARGYTLAGPGQVPDLGFNITLFKNTNIDVYYPGWYWGYGGYYPPDYWYGGWYGWDYYYPYYPVYVTSYTAGSIVIDMVDLKNADPITEQISIPWNVYIRALLTGYHTQAEITGSIDQAFEQTPQLTK
jgi:hypothetical protein